MKSEKNRSQNANTKLNEIESLMNSMDIRKDMNTLRSDQPERPFYETMRDNDI